MQAINEPIANVILGNPDDAISAAPLKPFDNSVLEFFNDLSKRLIKEREYPEVATFGFWCRKASLLKEKENYNDLDARLGRGVVFHSTPSNVPVNFAYSFAAGLLAGNANIVRLPGKDFEQVTIIVEAIRELLSGEHKLLKPYLNFIKYPPDKKLHVKYSSLCDVRIIWGGDETIKEIREAPLKPKATELTFADRYSIAVINADEYLKANDKPKIAQDFYNDTYLSDQNACTSPRIVFWLGACREAAKEKFWESVGALAREKYELAPVQAVGKLNAFYKAAAGLNTTQEPSMCTLINAGDNYVTRIKVKKADENLMQYKYNSGFFFEMDIDVLTDILPICADRLQTLTYYGISQEDIINFISKYKPKGIDRAVPMGKSMDFALTWDGYDLIRELSRKVSVF